MLTLLVAGSAWGKERARWVLDAHAQGQRAFHVIAGNRHDVYALAAAAKARGVLPQEALDASVLARAFTAHQLAALVEDTLPLMMADKLAYAAVVDPLDLYADEDELRPEEGLALLQRGLAKLRLLARRRPSLPLMVVQHPGAGQRVHWDALLQAVDACEFLEAAPRRATQAALAAWVPVQAPEVTAHGPHAAHVPQPARPA
ncbi:MAG TPA: hypothetical protein VGR28_01150 [Candidatus Thermoplasmatota archaeon]|jgi:hypothetical protein|nr:hypothetical protein [Candidatus Thermoplasmatota archaeon]